MWIVLLGFVLGFVGAMPVIGPIAALVLERSLDGRVRSAVGIGMGAALAEGGYAFLAYVGYHQFIANRPEVLDASRLVTAGVLLILAMHLSRERSPPVSRDPSSDGGSVTLGFAVAAFNPSVLLTWAVVLSAAGGAPFLALPAGHGPIFAVGVAAGVASWFTIIAHWIDRRRSHFSPRTIAWIRRTMAVLLVALACGLIVSSV